MAQMETIYAHGVIDMAYLESSSFGQDDLVLRAIDVLCEQLREQVSELNRAFGSGDWIRLRLVAHSLKSAAGMLGMASLKQHLREIEGHGAAFEDRASLSRLLSEITQLCRLAAEELAEVRFKYAGEI